MPLPNLGGFLAATIAAWVSPNPPTIIDNGMFGKALTTATAVAIAISTNALALSALVIVRHVENIKRLLEGSEHKILQRK